MLKTYFVDGDKGGVGKSFVSRCVVDMLLNSEKYGHDHIGQIIVVDADPANPDVCGPGGFVSESINDTQILPFNCPIRSESDWISAIDAVHNAVRPDANARVVFSLPAAAGLVIRENATVIEMMQFLEGVPVWVLSNDESSVKQLADRVEAFPLRYSHGFVIRNLKHGVGDSFHSWNESMIRRKLLLGQDGYNWNCIDLPVLNSVVVGKIGMLPLHRAAEKALSPAGGIGAGSRIVIDTYRAAAGNALKLLETPVEVANG